MIELSLYFALKLCYNVKGFIDSWKGKFIMKTNYKILWHILLDRNMKKLSELAGVGTYKINKLNKNKNVTVQVIGRFVNHWIVH